MFRRILVPLDGSAFSEAALVPAIALARRTHGELHLVMVHDIWPPLDPGLGLGADYIAESRAWEDQRLKALAERIPTSVRTRTVLIDGAIVPALESYMRAHHIDLVIMTSHGRGGLHRSWLGSVTDGLIRGGVAPVLVLRAGRDRHPDASLPERILVPLDGSPRAEAVLPLAAELAHASGGLLRLMRVVRPRFRIEEPKRPLSVREDEPANATRMADARGYLETLARPLILDGLAVDVLVTFAGEPAPAIVREAEGWGADLVACSTHGRGGVRRMVLGSVADKVVRSGVAATLVVRPDGVPVPGEAPDADSDVAVPTAALGGER